MLRLAALPTAQRASISKLAATRLCAWDTKGNAYLQCQLFMRGPGVTNNPDASSAVYVFRSTGKPRRLLEFHRTPVVEPRLYWSIFEDKPFMTVDNAIAVPTRTGST